MDPGRAVGALWQDAAAHSRFLEEGHDAVADRQRGTYTALDVTLADVVLRVGEPPRGGILRARRGACCATRDAYRRDQVSGLRDAAGAADDYTAVEGDLVALEASWTVPATGRRGGTGSGG